MDNIIAPTLQILPIATVDNKPLTLEVSNLPTTVKSGDAMFLEILQEGNAFKLNAVIDNQKIPLEFKGELPLKATELQNYALRVVSENTVQLVPFDKKGQLPEVISQHREVAIIKEVNVSLPQVKTLPLPGQQIVQKIVADLGLSPQLQNKVAQLVPEAYVSVRIENLIPQGQAGQDILQPLRTALQTLATAVIRQDSPQIAAAQQQVVQAFNNLAAQKFIATPIPTPAAPSQASPAPIEIANLTSPLGKIALEVPLKMPVDSRFEMSIGDVQINKPQMSFEPLKVLEKIFVSIEALRIFPKADRSRLLHLLQNRDEGIVNLLKVFEPLQSNTDLTQQVLQKLPTFGKTMLSNMISFYKGAAEQEARSWLGPELSTALQNAGEKGQLGLRNLQEMVTQSFRETPAWRVMEIPFFDGSQMIPFKLSVKKDKDQQERSSSKDKGGVRFMIETDFSKLGAFQLDGFSVIKEHRLDLIIRTSKMQSDDFCSHLMNLFKTSLYNVGYVGNIAINQKESFVKIDAAEKQLPEGVFI